MVATGSIPSSAIASGTFSNWCVKWIYGAPGSVCSTGCCCAWTVPYGHGGQGGITTYCGNGHCGQGATGGGGLVKITYF